MKQLAAAVTVLIAACDGGGSASRIDIELDIPADDRDGLLLGDLESLQLRVSDGRDFVAVQLYRIEDGLPSALVLPDVPAGNQVLFDLSGLAGGAEIGYGRTCRVRVTESDESISARLYFSRVGRFRAGQDPIEPQRRSGLTFSDDQGRAIVTGGSQLPIVELFDPRVGDFSEAGEALARRAGAIAVRSDGTAVIAGGVAPEGGALVAAVEQIDPSSQSPDERIQLLGPATQPEAEKSGLALAAMPDDSVLLTGGRTSTGEISGGMSLLIPGDDEFRAIGSLAEPRTGHTASVGLGGVAYIIGGLSPDEVAGTEVATGSIELYRSQNQSVRTLVPRLEVPRFGHSATVLDDGRILIVGGKIPRDAPCGTELEIDPETCFDAVAEVEVFDPIVGEVRPVAEGIPGGVYDHTATLVAGGRVLIAGGFDGDGEPRDDARLFDPQVEALVPTRELTRPRAGHTATQLCDDTVLLVGGTSDDDEPPPSERYNPAALRLP